MLHIASLVCPGCADSGQKNQFYDSVTKLPCFLECKHSLCSECVKKYSECPICKKRVVITQNYAARGIYEECQKHPIMVFKRWYKAKDDGEETCSNCFYPNKKLRLCFTCELELDNLDVEHIRKNGKQWKNHGQHEVFQRKREKLKMRRGSNQRTPHFSFWKFDSRPKFRFYFYKLANRVICSDCSIDYHKGHKIKTLLQMEFDAIEMKKSSSLIATNFIQTELRRRKGKCVIRTMRLHRTCEILAHLARLYYPNPKEPILFADYHYRYSSDVNKFFESLGGKNIDGISKDEGDSLILSLENQLNCFECQENCNCGIFQDEMKKLNFGNQVDKMFVEIINGLKNEAIDECPFQSDQFQTIRDKALEMSEMKLYLIYTAFCWNENNICGMFDNLDRQPCICPNCQIATCMDCLKTNFSYRCPFCGDTFFDCELGSTRVYNVNNDVLNLVDFYKNNCIEIYEEWWNCKASQIEFCLACSSYSEQLEVCVYCDLIEKRRALKTKPDIESYIQYRKEMPLYFKYDGLKTFPMRWQCSDCKERLEANWEHKHCKEDSESQYWKGTWNRGCSHQRSRMFKRKCRGHDVNCDECEYSSIALKDIGFYEFAMKVATMGLVHRILKSGIEENVHCKLRKIRMLRRQGLLKSKTRYYFKNSMAEKITEELKNVTLEIPNLIEILKTEWRNYQKSDSECSCTTIWNKADNLLKSRLKEISNVLSNEGIDRCPLELKHNIDLNGISNDDDPDDIQLFNFSKSFEQLLLS